MAAEVSSANPPPGRRKAPRRGCLGRLASLVALLALVCHAPPAVRAFDRSQLLEGWGDKAIGCANIGILQGDMDDLDDESCAEYVRLMARPFLPRGGETRHPRLIAHQNSTHIEGDPECNGRGWLLGGAQGWCSCFYGAEGDTCAGTSDKASRRPRAAITYLLYGTETYFDALEASIRHITASFLNEFPYYDIVVFHSSNFAAPPPPGHWRRDGESSYLELLQEATFVKINFVEITIDYREEFREQFSQYVPTGMPCGNYSVNYLHMGRFFQYLMFRHPAVAEYDYLWRLDADIETRLGIPCDVFDIMVRSHAVLGYYYYSDYDHHNCGLYEGRNATYKYAREHGFSPNHLDILPPQSAYMGFWGVFDMAFWRSPPVMAFSDYIDSTALAYTNRLGEQAYYALCTALLVSPAALHQYAGVGPFLHRGKEIIMGKREINNFNLIRDDVFCPEASEWDCNEIFECTERALQGRVCVPFFFLA